MEKTMIHMQEDDAPAKSPPAVVLEPHEQSASSRMLRFWQAVQRYPLPLMALLLLLLSFGCWMIGWQEETRWTLLTIILLGGLTSLWNTGRQIVHGEVSVDVIALLAMLGSLWLGEYIAGAVIVLMLSGGEALEAYAVRRAKTSLSALAQRAPRVAHIWREQELIDLPAEAVTVGMTLVVKPGELVPVDGMVVQGGSNVSEADLTGEPVPVRKTPGMAVFSGSVNLDGVLEVRASKTSVESKYASILRLVQQAQEQKAPIHRLANRYSIAFTVGTLALAALAWFLSGQSVNALAVLVVATPCPLILATPIAIMSGIDRAAHHGIIVKSGATIEQLGEVQVAVFDKTGTLTLGTPQMTEIVLAESDQQQEAKRHLLYYAACVELLSAHILAHAIVDAAQKAGLALAPADDFEEQFGKGVSGRVPRFAEDASGEGSAGSVAVAVGNRTFLQYREIALPLTLRQEREQRTAQGQLCSFLALDGVVVGLLVLEDVPRPDLASLTPALKAEGVKQTILLTGDAQIVAERIGARAQMDRIVARCLPEQKVQVIRDVLARKQSVLMVGDGINDAPALATATVGMALGAQGLTAAASAADAVLLSTDITRVVTAVHLGRRVMRVARQGIWIGMGLSIIAMGFAALGYLPPTSGAILQEGIDVLVILNALRVSRLRPRSGSSSK